MQVSFVAPSVTSGNCHAAEAPTARQTSLMAERLRRGFTVYRGPHNGKPGAEQRERRHALNELAVMASPAETARHDMRQHRRAERCTVLLKDAAHELANRQVRRLFIIGMSVENDNKATTIRREDACCARRSPRGNNTQSGKENGRPPSHRQSRKAALTRTTQHPGRPLISGPLTKSRQRFHGR